MPRLTFNRKDMAGQSIGIATAFDQYFISKFNQRRLKALAVWRYRGASAAAKRPARSRHRSRPPVV
jgi:hypothetical protein